MPAWLTALGKAVLAQHPWEHVTEILPRKLWGLSEHSITDHDRLREELAEIRRTGIALDNEESAYGLKCVAVALALRTPPQDAISCSVPLARFTAEQETKIRKLLADTARSVAATP